MNHTLLIIPGFGESTDDAPYVELARMYKGSVVTFNPKWNYRTATDWLRDLELTLEMLDTQNTSVVSFSLGAYIALLAAESYPFRKVILCSISPFFNEQISYMPPPAQKFFGKRRMKDFSLHTIPKRIKCPVVCMFGSDDWPFAINGGKKLSQKYKGTFELIPNTQHELTHEYLKAIIKYCTKIEKLNQ
jgi:pimeloyl-ACP methyl ester carboxylesterase